MATITGTNGDDRLYGGAYAEYIEGLAGNDTLDGNASNDTLDGGLGDDLYILVDFNSAYPYDATNNPNVVFLDAGGVDTLITDKWAIRLAAGIDNLELRYSGNSYATGYGNSLDNFIANETRDGTVSLDGADGNDTLVGSDAGTNFYCLRGSGDCGDDVIVGGGGWDYLGVGRWSSVVVDFRDGTVTGGGTSGSGSVQFTKINKVGGGSFDDLFIAGDRRIVVEGNEGDDTVLGGDGHDLIYGGSDHDVIRGGAGNDILYSDDTPDSYEYSPGGHDAVWGGGGRDYLYGGEGEDTLVGGNGADTLAGGDDADVLGGGLGDDHLLWDPDDSSVAGGAGTDTLHEDEFDLDLTAISNGTIRGVEVIDLTNASSSSDNTLTLDEADLLALSSTTDTLTVFGNIGDAVDIVGDFSDLGVSGDFHRYQVGAGTLLVERDITSVF